MKKMLSLLLITVILLLGSSCTKNPIPPSQDQANEVIPYPTYAQSFDGLYSFSEKIFMAEDEGATMGYMDRNGRIVIGAQNHIAAHPFSYGLAVILQVSSSDIEPYFETTYYYINTKGQKMFGEEYLYANRFSEGKAVVQKQDESWWVIDIFGNDLFKIEKNGYQDGEMEYHEGMLWVDGRMVNETGQSIIPEIEFTGYTDFNEGLAVVQLSGGVLGYISRQGKLVIETKYVLPQNICKGDLEIYLFHGGLAYVGGDYINTKGEVVISQLEGSDIFEYPPAGVIFSEGLAAVSIGGKWGYINTEGEIVIEPVYGDALPFSEGLAAVTEIDYHSISGIEIRYNSDYGFIDTNGKLVIDYLYDSGAADYLHIPTLSMRNGLIYVGYHTQLGDEDDGSGWVGYIDCYGNRIVPHK